MLSESPLASSCESSEALSNLMRSCSLKVMVDMVVMIVIRGGGGDGGGVFGVCEINLSLGSNSGYAGLWLLTLPAWWW